MGILSKHVNKLRDSVVSILVNKTLGFNSKILEIDNSLDFSPDIIYFLNKDKPQLFLPTTRGWHFLSHHTVFPDRQTRV